MRLNSARYGIRGRRVPLVLFVLACVVLLVFARGCGWIADTDRIVVAVKDGKEITRGDLKQLIHDMPDDERPLIQYKDDYLRALNRYIDDSIKLELARELEAAGKIDVSRDAARAQYLRAHPEFAAAFQIRDPSQLGMTQGDVEALKAAVEFGVDDEVDRMLGEEALAYKTYEAMQSGAVPMTREEVEREYELRKSALVKLEYIEFTAMTFPVDMPEAIGQAAQARRRIDAGESFEAVLAELVAIDPNRRTVSAAQNDPNSERFKTFWRTAHGAEAGKVYGPVILPAHQEEGPGPNGQTVARLVPAAHVVFKVTAHEPEGIMSFDEAKEDVARMILRRKVMEQLRAAHGVEVYPDKLPDPAGYGDQYKDLMIDTGRPAPVE